MDIEDLFENKNKYRHKQGVQDFSQGNSYKPENYYCEPERFNFFELLNSINNNKKLKITIFVVLFILIAVIIGLVVLLFPIIIKTINYIFQNGVSGLIDIVRDLLNNLWYGTK